MTDDELAAVIEQSYQLNDLTNHPGWPILVDFVQSVILAPQKKKLLGGTISNFEEYKRWAGFCSGAERVLEAHQVVAKVVLDEQAKREEKRVGQLDQV